jgi:DNA-binding CsgD family transcriptional regulator
MAADPDVPHTDLALALVFLAIVAGGITDLILDAPPDWASPHILVELALITLSLGLAAYLWWGWRRTRTALREARTALTARNTERDHWHASTRRLLEDLGVAVNRQFAAWELTRAEREVAVLLLKGLSHKEIAAQTSRSERTVRQHAVALYRKAGLAGRAALAAFFLGDLALPSEQSGDAPLAPGVHGAV